MGVYIKGVSKELIYEMFCGDIPVIFESILPEQIIEVKEPHGNLIDRDAFMEYIKEQGFNCAAHCIIDAPIIIEAESE